MALLLKAEEATVGTAVETEHIDRIRYAGEVLRKRGEGDADLNTHRLPCSPYADLSAMPEAADFTPHGAAARQFSHGGRPYFALFIPG